MTYKIEPLCERMVAVRLMTPITIDEAKAFSAELNAVLAQVKGGSIVCVDLRQADLFPPHVMAHYMNLMRQLNGHFLRSVFWVNDQGLHSKQIERMVSEAKNPLRRVLHTATAVESWLGEVASAAERRVLHNFVYTPVSNSKHA